MNGAVLKIDPREMPLTGLANAAIDSVAPAREAFASSLAQYTEGDLLCYRADGPCALVSGRRSIGTDCWRGRGGATMSTSLSPQG